MDYWVVSLLQCHAFTVSHGYLATAFFKTLVKMHLLFLMYLCLYVFINLIEYISPVVLTTFMSGDVSLKISQPSPSETKLA